MGAPSSHRRKLLRNPGRCGLGESPESTGAIFIAADKLGIAQPTLSMRMRQLETDADIRLLRRPIPRNTRGSRGATRRSFDCYAGSDTTA